MDSTVFNVGDVWTKVFFYYSTLRHVFEEKIFLSEAHYVLQYRYCTLQSFYLEICQKSCFIMLLSHCTRLQTRKQVVPFY